MQEIALPGGNVGGAVRVGDTVRRPTGPWTPAVHALLAHLATAGLPGVPRVHGFDERGREVLDYLPGTSYGEQVADDVLVAAMEWLAEYHRVVASYRPEDVVTWRAGRSVLGAEEIVCMHDFGYYNWIGDERGFSGVIDWDLAGRGRSVASPTCGCGSRRSRSTCSQFSWYFSTAVPSPRSWWVLGVRLVGAKPMPNSGMPPPSTTG